MLYTYVFLQREKVLATLEGHNGTVTCAEFCPHYTATLVSISEDRTYKVGSQYCEQSPLLLFGLSKGKLGTYCFLKICYASSGFNYMYMF